MDIKELKSLVEAYQQVHVPQEETEIDEALTGERYKKVMRKPGGTAYSRKVSADPSKRATRGGRGGESDFGAGDRGSGNKAARRAAALKNEELDIFDVVLEFLQVEGFAETLEEAEWMMANELGAEDIANIIGEALTGERYKKVMNKPGWSNYTRMHSADPEKRPTRGGRGGKQSDFGSPDRGGGHKSMRRRGMKVPQGDD